VIRPAMEVLRGELRSVNGGLSQSDPTLPSGWAAPSSTSILTEGGPRRAGQISATSEMLGAKAALL
jgi:hypothetical protein